MTFIGRSKYGKGLYASRNIQEGILIVRYLGILVPIEEYKKMKDTRYCMAFSKTMVLDGNIESNKARFINHCFNPNCEAAEDDDGIGIYAMRKISRGEELFLDYGYHEKEIRNDPFFKWYRNLVKP